MTEHTTFRELEDAHDREASAARDRIEQAEEHIHYYRSQMIRMQEHFYDIARSAGVQDDPRFQHELRRVTTQIDDNVSEATRVVIRFDDERTEMTTRHRREREELRERLRQTGAAQ
ncbi:hypothetical protein [Leifsonia sp. C5G2]|uniref:hypothetical protein n=1 Tax=Leifsonia sp. C5G2 TaxID=2735269 RepID=UPI001585A8D9|nr:hypothetical protein [Leifsonia sp. C5G2]NUU06038.1 hypothetical protein [Leifsonia sp. C5G2]